MTVYLETEGKRPDSIRKEESAGRIGGGRIRLVAGGADESRRPYQ